jgi:hypothetical protein
MFVQVQLPFADVRPFVAGARRLATPPWPLSEPNREYVRAVGQVRERRRGGVSPWTGEDVYCDARRALRIEPGGWHGRRDPCVFRRYLSDGCARTRVEVGMLVAPACATVPAALERALGLTFSVPSPAGKVAGDLFGLHLPLARHLLHSTTGFRAVDPFWGESWWLSAVQPVVIAECRDSSWTPPPGARAVRVAERHGVSLHVFATARAGRTVRVWLLRAHPGADREIVRRLRVHLLMLHAERMALRQVLRLLAKGALDTDRGSAEFERLQRYLLGAFHGLGKKRRRGFHQEEIFDAAYRADGLVSEDVRIAILAQLEQARPNIRRLVGRRLADDVSTGSRVAGDLTNRAHTVVNQKFVFGDVYEVSGPAGAIGPNSQVERMVVSEVWNEISSSVELDDLASQLRLLHSRLSMLELTAGERDGLLELARAAGAAKDGDGPGALAHLARAGRWVLRAAREVGVDVAAGVIQELLTTGSLRP